MDSPNLKSGGKYKFDDDLIENSILSISNGEISGISHLYDHTKSAVYGYALSILKNPCDAEDVLQDTYIRIFSTAQSYSPLGKPMAWILTITRNLCLMKLRGDKKMSDVEIENLNVSSSTDIIREVENRLLLNDAFKLLTDEELQILFLHALCGLKHKEISNLLEIGLATVISKYNRSLKKLKKYLTMEEENDEKLGC